MHVARGASFAGEEVGGDEALVAPIAIEVERGVDEAERTMFAADLADRNERGGGEAGNPRRRLGPRQRLHVDGYVEVSGSGGADRGEVYADGSKSGCAHG